MESKDSPEFKHISDECIYEDEDFTFMITLWKSPKGQMTFAHLYVRRFSPTVYKRIQKGLRVYTEMVQEPLYACGTIDDEKWEHFVSSLGFQPLLDGAKVPCTDGTSRRVFVYLGDNNKNGRA